MLPLWGVNSSHLATAKQALNRVDLALPTWAFEVLPFALGLPAHVGGVGHEVAITVTLTPNPKPKPSPMPTPTPTPNPNPNQVHGSETSAEAADVPAELISALRHHNHLDLELFRHAG